MGSAHGLAVPNCTFASYIHIRADAELLVGQRLLHRFLMKNRFKGHGFFTFLH
jgi:hypothetical protein